MSETEAKALAAWREAARAAAAAWAEQESAWVRYEEAHAAARAALTDNASGRELLEAARAAARGPCDCEHTRGPELTGDVCGRCRLRAALEESQLPTGAGGER